MEPLFRCLTLILSILVAYALDKMGDMIDFKLDGPIEYRSCPTCRGERVMFLPDAQKPCQSFIDCLKEGQQPMAPRPCTVHPEDPDFGCPLYHGWPEEKSCALAEILRTLNGARKSIYLSMYVFTLDVLAEYLVYLRLERNIAIYILTDRLQNQRQGNDQITGLKRAGINVRWNPKAQMHNKHCIVDQRILISGSANWSHYAFNSNDETLFWSENPKIVQPIVQRFRICYNSASPSLVLFPPMKFRGA